TKAIHWGLQFNMLPATRMPRRKSRQKSALVWVFVSQLAQVEPSRWFPLAEKPSVRRRQNRPKSETPYCAAPAGPRTSSAGPRDEAVRGDGRQRNHAAAVAAPSTPADTNAAFRTF